MVIKELKKIRTNDSGMIMVTVLLLTVALSILTISILSINVSQVKSGRGVVDSIRARELALGAFYQYHTARTQGLGIGNSLNATTEVMSDDTGSKTYSIRLDNLGTGGSPNNTDHIDVTVNY